MRFPVLATLATPLTVLCASCASELGSLRQEIDSVTHSLASGVDGLSAETGALLARAEDLAALPEAERARLMADLESRHAELRGKVAELEQLPDAQRAALEAELAAHRAELAALEVELESGIVASPAEARAGIEERLDRRGEPRGAADADRSDP